MAPILHHILTMKIPQLWHQENQQLSQKQIQIKSNTSTQIFVTRGITPGVVQPIRTNEEQDNEHDVRTVGA